MSISAEGKSISDPGTSTDTAAEVDFRDPDIHCPLNLGCPYLANDLAADKPITLITLSSQQAGLLAPPSTT